MTGTNYMGGARNAAKARFKDTTGRAQKMYFGKQRLGMDSRQLLSTQSTTGDAMIVKSEPPRQPISLDHAPKPIPMTEGLQSASNEEEEDETHNEAVDARSNNVHEDLGGAVSTPRPKRKSKVLEAYDVSKGEFLKSEMNRLRGLRDLAGLDTTRNAAPNSPILSRPSKRPASGTGSDGPRKKQSRSPVPSLSHHSTGQQRLAGSSPAAPRSRSSSPFRFQPMPLPENTFSPCTPDKIRQASVSPIATVSMNQAVPGRRHTWTSLPLRAASSPSPGSPNEYSSSTELDDCARQISYSSSSNRPSLREKPHHKRVATVTPRSISFSVKSSALAITPPPQAQMHAIWKSKQPQSPSPLPLRSTALLNRFPFAQLGLKARTPSFVNNADYSSSPHPIPYDLQALSSPSTSAEDSMLPGDNADLTIDTWAKVGDILKIDSNLAGKKERKDTRPLQEIMAENSHRRGVGFPAFDFAAIPRKRPVQVRIAPPPSCFAFSIENDRNFGHAQEEEEEDDEISSFTDSQAGTSRDSQECEETAVRPVLSQDPERATLSHDLVCPSPDHALESPRSFPGSVDLTLKDFSQIDPPQGHEDDAVSSQPFPATVVPEYLAPDSYTHSTRGREAETLLQHHQETETSTTVTDAPFGLTLSPNDTEQEAPLASEPFLPKVPSPVFLSSLFDEEEEEED